MPRRRDRELAGVAPRARHAKGDGNRRAGRLRQRPVRASRRGHHLLALGRQVHGQYRRAPTALSHDYEIAYTFGVYPLQQYLIAFPGGRYQALGIAWDSRPKDQGGQRWFQLYPGQQLKPGDPLHWTGRDQTWNYQCADCHSTDLQKNYDLAADTYATTWTDLDVACEACHGPGSRHVAWTKAQAAGGSYPPGTDAARMGLTNWLKPTDTGHWEMNPETGIARRTEKLASTELETCAACHSRRKVIAKSPRPGEPFLDGYLPALLEPGLYHADGQIDGEVYEYGSFLQSRMHAAGVTCSNCHDPHSAKLRAEGNGALRAMPFAGAFRRARASSSRARQRRRAVRQLPHADKDLHGRRCAARPQHPRSASRSVDFARHAERLQPVPRRSARPMGRRRPWPAGIPAGGRPPRITAPRSMPGGSEPPMPSSSSIG